MSQPISDTYAHQLQQMRTDLIAQLRAQRGGKIGRAAATDDVREDQSGDWMQLDPQRDLALAMDGRETAQLVAIDAALKRIAQGDYGICTDCGIDIPTARLHASPTTLRCVACQTTAEQAHGGEARPTM